MIYRMFEIDPLSRELKIVPEIRATEPFKTILKRTSKCKGDADGKKKILNEKEILYAYFIAVPEGNLRYETEANQLAILKKRLDLPDDWKPDDLVKEAIKVIKESRNSLSTPLLEYAMDLAKAMEAWFKEKAKILKEAPNTFSPKTMAEFQDAFMQVPKIIEMVETARAKVMAENESMKTNKNRLISKFELEDGEDTPVNTD